MDNLLGKAVGKVFGDDDERPQGGNVTHGGAYPAGGGYPHIDDDDLRGAASVAAKETPEDQDFFTGVLANILNNKPQAQIAEEDLDEEDAVRSHGQFFGFGGSSSPHAATQEPASSSSLGSAAAMQALKLFTSSSSSSSSDSSASQGQGQSQSAFVGLAMAQAAKLFDAQASQGKVAAGADKKSAVMQAGEMALKMYFKSKGGGAAGGAGGDGGMGGLLNLAGKFMK
ncbi:hypothetical protein C8A00DRAFT_13390 [Chaetomidium leptoderma]|uniref:DUF7721 domain-containing protein n=1 Tax=Chaetomidium leptoderma TaxID=669021 RepID=A0AAN6ZZ58_9PEZI|nr:hypothetical protein C8A00DRAFT_13390 [Chaetomidium leptoderma]